MIPRKYAPVLFGLVLSGLMSLLVSGIATFRATGLVELERRFIIFTPFDGAFFRQLDDGLSWLPLGAQYCMATRVPS